MDDIRERAADLEAANDDVAAAMFSVRGRIQHGFNSRPVTEARRSVGEAELALRWALDDAGSRWHPGRYYELAQEAK